ncbi:MAG: type I-E CRISPR-associated protein Cas5/CasD [Nitrospirales bacterium]|nr:MAG: type I-E CRISPR-associated protein Cas5/CasD [Nitrospirales bacterium]
MRDYLVFQLYGPLASWGDIAVGDTRPSAMTPTKSAVLGIVSAALGLRRPDTARTEAKRGEWESLHIALAEGYGMAVKIETLGLPLSDYHTAQVPSSGSGRNRKVFSTRRDELTHRNKFDLNTVLSRREYRQDAFYVVALWARTNAPHNLHELRHALLEPCFMLYLGRKSCPLALPLQPEVKSTEAVEDALASRHLTGVLARVTEAVGDAGWTKIYTRFQTSSPLLLWDGDAETRLSPEQTGTRRDSMLSRHRWQFTVRNEHQAHLGKGGQL